ncbi:sensor histidine kinase [Roseivivax sp. GX 12232]|uniref:sensor histidine kinase n=1 Tax=Roseivivax sp. GX 12232 TaxID=2900547 RepID=UPI001E56DEE5|nr:sensor histidine kinase [Roseivivax sp. GX 12232]MCE0506882.1 sensor histidine kinase [Roseivivax sp. GX 12232]
MISFNGLVAICLAYVVLLFAVAFTADRLARLGRGRWLRSPLVYTLSLSIYATAWTFYGAVGSAVRSGLEFVAIYLGPSIVMFGWWWLLRKLVRIGRSQRITSVADLISSRFGKSNLLAVLVTLLSVVAATPYIALQLQSVTVSFEVFGASTTAGAGAEARASNSPTAFWVALGLALFTVIFGTRNLDANERHHGVVMAIALEAVVKLFALMTVGIFVVWGLSGGVPETLARIEASELGQWQIDGGRWAGLIFLSGAAFLCLPRMFQVLVVEAADEDHLRTASWAFPAYLLAMSVFVMPIAVVGLDLLPEGSNPDLFVLTLPLSQGAEGVAVLSFLGGFSSATSMVIVAAIALSTMVSNHIVMPLWLRLTGGRASISGDVRNVVLTARRVSIVSIVLLGYVYYSVSGGGAALAAIGIISFVGVVQVLPSMIGGIFWRGATRTGAIAGLVTGSVIWLYTFFLPSIGLPIFSETLMAEGPAGLSWLRPQALFGIGGIDPMLHALLWSLSLNSLAFFGGSVLSFPSPVERLQGAQFVNIFQHSGGPRSWASGVAQTEDLLIMAQRILGPQEAIALFAREARAQGGRGDLPEPRPDFLETLERELAGSVGAATAHAMIGQIVGGTSVSVQDLMAVADESAQLMEYSARLETQSAELSRTARQLREANDKLTRLSVQKDSFLSQISHELRTPMASIRAFSEILRDSGGLSEAEQSKFASIIHDEAIRLTRLLDDILDLSVMENGRVHLNLREGRLSEVLDRAVASAAAGEGKGAMEIRRNRATEDHAITTDLDRLAQVFINLISNAQKYCEAARPRLTIRVQDLGESLAIDFIDNGHGIPREARDVIFEKFSRISDQKAGGAGLGLAICRQVLERLGGTIAYMPGEGGAAFRVMLPRGAALAAAE